MKTHVEHVDAKVKGLLHEVLDDVALLGRANAGVSLDGLKRRVRALIDSRQPSTVREDGDALHLSVSPPPRIVERTYETRVAEVAVLRVSNCHIPIEDTLTSMFLGSKATVSLLAGIVSCVLLGVFREREAAAGDEAPIKWRIEQWRALGRRCGGLSAVGLGGGGLLRPCASSRLDADSC